MNGQLTRARLPRGTFECATRLETENGRPVFGPDTPESIPGNAQYVFLLHLPRGPAFSLDILWPHRETPPRPGFDYPHNANFSEVLAQVIFLQPRGGDWQRITAPRPRPFGVEVDIPALEQPAWLSVGIPYFACQYEALLDHLEQDPAWSVTKIGGSLEGRPLHACLRPARGQSRGLFLLTAYQHYGEWAGLHAIDALMRNLPPEADAFTWAVVPCLNPDGLYRGWRGDLMHRGDALNEEHGGNINRAWNPPCLPESAAAAGFFKNTAQADRPLHALDFHMGWSSPQHSGGGLTVYHPGEIDPETDAHMRRFTEDFFKTVPIQPFAWEHSRLNGPGATPWFTRELGCPAQTVEFSRFQAHLPGSPPRPVTPDYYRNLGPQIAECLILKY
ncbi:MAG: hypothetical protein JJU05_13840 [Verrucomicrobia bacterium]|nr:hypothetical protein [Verrucomicrobiota bacterium]MCH8527980.1 hypothetical protein [Kiritimatiellia bacterium]